MIKITPHEFKMLQQDYHPEYVCKYEEDEDELGIVEDAGKGSDVIYKKTLIRQSDKKEFVLRTIANLSGGFNHDDPYDCDFEIDLKKKNVLDPYNELDLDAAKKREEAESLKTKKLEEEIEKKKTLIEFDLKNPIITPDEFEFLCLTFLKIVTFQDLTNFYSKYVLPSAEKYNIDSQSLHYHINNANNKSQMNKKIANYKKSYNLKHSIANTVELKIKGKNVVFSEEEIESLVNQIKNKDHL